MKKFVIFLAMTLFCFFTISVSGIEKQHILNKGSTNNNSVSSFEDFFSINQASNLAMEEIENYTGADSFTFPASLPIGIVEENSFSNPTITIADQVFGSENNQVDAEKNFLDAENGPTTVLKKPMESAFLTGSLSGAA